MALPRTVVAVTGAAGYLGQRLLTLLDADPEVDRIIGVDVAEPAIVSAKLEMHEADVRDARLPKILAGADAVVHLAFVVDPDRDEERMRAINVDGTRNVLEAAVAAGARKIVYASSATVYGAHPDNDFPLTEESPLRANGDFASAAHKLAVERDIEAFRREHGDVVVTVLRPAIVFGPDVENFVSRQLEAPRVTLVRGYEPPFQVVHQDDVASALHHALRHDLNGAYNVSADGWLSVGEVLELAGKRPIHLPEAVAFSLAERLWRAGLSEAPPGELHYIMHPWAVDNAKLRATGWAPARTNREAVLETVTAHRAFVSVGRARVRKQDLAKGAAATLGAMSAVALARRARRRKG